MKAIQPISAEMLRRCGEPSELKQQLGIWEWEPCSKWMVSLLDEIVS